jgi:hypothetical protein
MLGFGSTLLVFWFRRLLFARDGSDGGFGLLFTVGVFGFRRACSLQFPTSEVVAFGEGGGDFLSLAFRLLSCG